MLVGNFEEDLDPLKKEVIDEINLNPNIVYVGYQNDIRPYLAISNCFVFPFISTPHILQRRDSGLFVKQFKLHFLKEKRRSQKISREQQ